jgi:hypothetical protein
MNMHICICKLMMSIDFKFKIKNSTSEFEGSTSEDFIRLGTETHHLSDLKEIVYCTKNNDVTLINKSGKRIQFTVVNAQLGRLLSERPPVRFVIESLDEIIGDNKEPKISNGNDH